MNQAHVLGALMILSALDVARLAERAEVPKAKVVLFLQGKEPMTRSMFARCIAVARAEIAWRREAAEALLHGPLFSASPVGCAISPANLEAYR